MHSRQNNMGRTVLAASALLTVLAAASPLQARERVEQLSEDSATTRVLPAQAQRSVLSAASSSRVCEPGAKWIRLGFKSLVLKSYDSLVITSSGGDRYVFQGGHWNNRAFNARALRGSCVDIKPYFSSPSSGYQVASYDFGTRALAQTTVTVAGAGDICETSSMTTCKATSDLIVSINPTAVFTAGDNVYNNATLSDFNARYEPTWGRFKSLTNPTPGNHEYQTPGAAGYFDYFTGVLTGTGADRAKGWYSWDVGDWHFVALNTTSGGSISTAQTDWLDADLKANTKPCTAAYFHHPMFSVGYYYPNPSVKPLYDKLYQYKADLVMVGHDHNYQRYAKMNSNQTAATDGFRQVLVGTGGRGFYGITGSHPLLEVSNANTHGVLKLTLSATGYTGQFVRADYNGNGDLGSATRPESFTGTCNKAGSGGNVAPVANFTSTSTALTASFIDTSTDSDGSIASRSWAFGDGTTSTTANPSKTYAAAGTYNVTLTVTDNGGLTHSKTAAVTVGSPNVAPVANFSATPNALTVSFTDTSTDRDGTIASRSWAFGDGTTSTTANPSKTYADAGIYTVSLTVTDNGGARNTVSKSVTVSAGGTQSQLLRNPGFESGQVNWSWTNTNNSIAIYLNAARARTGNYLAWLNGRGTSRTHTSTLSQSVSIPAGKASAKLSFYLQIETAETLAIAYDKLTLQVLNASGQVLMDCGTYSNLNASASYVLKTCDLSPYIGQTVTIKFTGIEDESLKTGFLIDDMSLIVM